MSATEMHPLVKNRINVLLRMIGETNKTQQDIELVERLFDKEKFSNIWIDNNVNIDFPAKSMTEVKQILKTFAKAGYMLDHLYESETNPIWYIKGINTMIRIAPYWNTIAEEGTTCKLVQVGTKTEVIPVYKLICDKDEVSE